MLLVTCRSLTGHRVACHTRRCVEQALYLARSLSLPRLGSPPTARIYMRVGRQVNVGYRPSVNEQQATIDQTA